MMTCRTNGISSHALVPDASQSRMYRSTGSQAGSTTAHLYPTSSLPIELVMPRPLLGTRRYTSSWAKSSFMFRDLFPEQSNGDSATSRGRGKARETGSMSCCDFRDLATGNRLGGLTQIDGILVTSCVPKLLPVWHNTLPFLTERTLRA
jgi:hypothetical protein